MKHFGASKEETADEEKIALIQRREIARSKMIAEFEVENPPMSDYDKQQALQDRVRLAKTMQMANRAIELKYSPKGTAKSNSPFLMANAVGLDSIKMLNKMEEDK